MINPIPAEGVGVEAEGASSESSPPRPIVEKSPAPEDRWSMRGIDGTVYGPVRFDELQRWHQEGRINEQCTLQRSGESRWQPALQVLGAAEKMTTYSPTPIHYTSSVQSAGRTYAPHNGTVILVLACLGAISIWPCSLAAVIMGYSELKGIRAGRIDPTGEPLVRAGYIVGWIFMLAWLLPLLCCCFVPVFDSL
jgi:hypothetical protein